jgi:hypothetical protein
MILVAFWKNKPTSQKPCMSRGIIFGAVKSCWVLVYSALLYKSCLQVIMFGLERFHLARSWNGWMMMSDCIMDDLIWWLSYRWVNFRCFRTLIFLSCHEPWFLIIKPLWVYLDFNCVMYSGLAFVSVLSFILCCYVSDFIKFDLTTTTS